MTRREFGALATSVSLLEYDDYAPECATCVGRLGGTLECIGCGRMVAAAPGDPVFDMSRQAGGWLETYDSGRGFSAAAWGRLRRMHAEEFATAEQQHLFR